MHLQRDRRKSTISYGQRSFLRQGTGENPAGEKMVAESGLPEYQRPPVVEVVCGVAFQFLDSLLIPHFGLLWNRFRRDYPRCQHVSPLLPLAEVGSIPPEIEITKGLPLPRIWFVHKDGTGIIQVQRDRFLHNWRKTKPEDMYPRYDTVIEEFKSRYSEFCAFLREENLGTLSPQQYELTYVNHIPEGDAWKSLQDMGTIFPDFNWNASAERFLPIPEETNLQMSFPLPSAAGKLHITIRSGKRGDQRVLLFELTARGIGSDRSPSAMWDWFGTAHEWIVRGFTDLTGKEAHSQLWRRWR